jgi:hypothetical protein
LFLKWIVVLLYTASTRVIVNWFLERGSSILEAYARVTRPRPCCK